MNKVILLTVGILSMIFIDAQNVGINQNAPTNSLHITPINIGDNPLRVDGFQAYTIGDTSILVVNPTTGIVKYMNASELSSSIINSNVINNIADSLLANSTFINNFGDSLFLSQDFIDSLTNHLYNNGDTLLYNSSFISSLRDSIDTDVDSVILTGFLMTIYENGNTASVNLSSLSDNDGDPTNEIELPATAVSGQVLTWDGSNWVAQNSASGADNWGTQTVISGSGFSGNGTSGTPLNFTETDGSISNELQTLTASGSNITLSNGGGTVTINDADSNPTNEHNTSVTLTGNTLNIIDGGGTINVDLTPIINTAVSNAMPAGTVSAYAGASIPSGYLICNGAPINRVTYANLFSSIGTMYGNGDGSTTFNLPNYSGQFLRGVDNGQGTDLDAATRTDRGDGTTGDAVGTKQTNQTLAHNHTVNPPATNSNSTGSHAHTVNPPSTTSSATGNHLHTVNPPATNTNTTGSHAHSVNPPNTATTTNGNHSHTHNDYNVEQPYTSTYNVQLGGGATRYNRVRTTSSAGNHSHTVNIAAFNSASNGNHTHSVNIAQFNSSTTGNHSHTTDIAQFNSSNTGNHVHSTDIAQFNSGNNGGLETRPTNVSVLWCIKF